MTQMIRTIRIATQGPAGPQGPAGGVTSVAGRTGAVTLTKSDVGLGNVPNADLSNAGNIASGTLADGRLSSNVALKAAANTWTAQQTFSGSIALQGGVAAFPTTNGTVLGVGAAPNKVSGSQASEDVVIGWHAGAALTDSGNTHHTLIGSLAGAAATAGAGGVVVGQKALNQATTIQSSVAVGGKAGANLTNAQSDTFVGYGAAQFSSGTDNGRRVFVGYNAGQYDSGDYNIHIGYSAGPQNASPNNNPANGDKNIGLGAFTLNALKGGVNNIAIGHQASASITAAFGNVAVGYQAGQNTTGVLNTFIGNNAGTVNISGSRNIYLGNGAGSTAPTNQSNTFIAGATGNDYISDVYFGKGVADASPAGYTIRGTGGLGNNIAGGSVAIAGGLSTGSGVSGDIVFQTGGMGAGTATSNSAVTALTIKGVTQQIIVGGLTPFVAWGGQTSSFPALKRSSAVVQARLADDSGFAQVQGKLTTHANAVAETITPDKTILLYDASGNAYKVPCIAV